MRKNRLSVQIPQLLCSIGARSLGVPCGRGQQMKGQCGHNLWPR